MAQQLTNNQQKQALTTHLQTNYQMPKRKANQQAKALITVANSVLQGAS
ncbi:MAG: hypothetical protein F6K19_45955 [Cyanothece sp. SIO1E1]|nr:hypothetical protein [Cyanothece sp. SIO1E1]